MTTKKSKFAPLCWALIAIVLLSAGVFAYVSSNRDLLHFSRVLGVAMLVAGVLNLCVCYIGHHTIHGVRWLEADAVTTMLLSIFPLFNDMIIPEVIPFFFGVWELFSGILKLSDTAELKHDGMSCWKGFAIISAIELLSGTMSLLKPIEIAVGFNHVIGIIFIVQSLGFILKSVMYKELVK